MRSGGLTDHGVPERGSVAWVRRYWSDLVALAVASLVVTQYWWAYFGLHDRKLWLPIAVFTLIEITRRVRAAHRTFERPIVFCGDRRHDLLAAIALAVGPWPIVPTLDVVSSVQTPARLTIAAAIAVAAGVLAFGRSIHHALPGRTRIRQLTTVPSHHAASLFVLGRERWEFTHPAMG